MEEIWRTPIAWVKFFLACRMEVCPLVLMRRRQATIEAVLKDYQHKCLYLVLSTHLDSGLPFPFIGGGEPWEVSVSVLVPGPLSDCLIPQSNPIAGVVVNKKTFFDCFA